jgi:hypothetical protein
MEAVSCCQNDDYPVLHSRRIIMKYLSLIAIAVLSLSLNACGPGQMLGPTLTATPTTTPTPTDTPTPTFTPTPTNTPTPTATPVPEGPCDNPLLPLGSINTWKYRVTTDKSESFYTIKSLGVEQGANIVALVEYSDQKNNLTFRDSIICQNGAIVNYPLYVLNMLFSEYLDHYIDTAHLSTDYAPNYQSLTRNNWAMNWQVGYLSENEAYLKNPMGDTDLYIPVSTQIDLSFNLTNAWESVTTPAGSYPHALKVTQDFSLPVTFLAVGTNSGTANSLKVNTSQWYEPYIGLVRAQITSASFGGNLSLPIQSTLELVEFTPGN